MACGVFCSIVFSMSCCGDLHNAVVAGVASALKYYRSKAESATVYDDFTNLIGIEKWDEDEIQSTGYVLHTLQAALWCLLKAANLGRDTDTTAAVAGALAGFWYKEWQIPRDWAEKTAKYEEIRQRVKAFYFACLKDSKTGRSASEYFP